MLGLWIALGVIGGLILLTLVWIIASYNGLVRSRNQVKESFSTMDVYMKKRYDLIPNYVEVVKGYAKHEKETLERVIAARNGAMNAQNLQDRATNEGELSSVLKQLAVVVERYPELKANTNFLSLQNQLAILESEIASSRKYYNGTVRAYNNKVEVFPSNIIAKWFKFETKPSFEITNAEERAVTKIEF